MALMQVLVYDTTAQMFDSLTRTESFGSTTRRLYSEAQPISWAHTLRLLHVEQAT
jgi:hypothetical protein